MVVFPGFELLDLSGPASVFAAASELLERPAYAVEAVSLEGGLVTSSAGIRVETRSTSSVRIGARDTVLVSGGTPSSLRTAIADADLIGWIRRACGRSERFGSICAGTLVLAETGRLDDARVTTHWAAADMLAEQRPQVKLQADALYVRDGRTWTSAGVATGIDMALAMVEADHGVGLMGDIAKKLVVYARRPGNQSQYSPVLDAQVEAHEDLRDLVAWIDENLGTDLVVADLAKRVGMSERSFYRRFTATVGQTPAKYLEEARMDRAKSLLEDGAAVGSVAESVGYRSHASFRRAFQGRFGVPPSFHRRMSGH